LNNDPLLCVDKIDLVRTIRQQEQQIEKLRQENDSLRKENEQLRDKPNPFEKKPQKTSGRPSKPPHLWGRKKGHKGSWRPVPKHIDREELLTLDRCPGCKNPLEAPYDFEEHIQEDIIPSRVQVTRYLHYRYWCRYCGEHVVAPHAPDEVPHGHLGPMTLAMMVMLKYHYVLPGNKIKAILKDLCGLTVSEGGIAHALQRLGRYLRVESEVILQKVREAAVKHADETGWKINGVNHWLWAFVNEMWAYYKIDRSRGSKVVKEVLGNPVPGILVSDFYSAYTVVEGEQQKCLVHLRREMRECRAKGPPGGDPEFEKPYKTLKRILDDADRLAQGRTALPALVYRRRVRRVKGRLIEFACAPFKNPHWQRLSKRLLLHQKEIFTFLDQPGVPSHNNTAERAIRPHVIIRNRSFQNRTPHGAEAHNTLTSLVGTLILQKKNPLEELRKNYPLHRQQATDNRYPLMFTA
jgi:transposase